MRLLLGYLAGALSTLSPCVLPALPLVVGSAARTHRMGPLAMAAGLVLTSTLVGFTLASIGPCLGLDPGVLRVGGALLLVGAGAVMLNDRLGDWGSRVLAPLANWGSRASSARAPSGVLGQFLVGSLLGLVWSPCAGPTLGAAVGLAAHEGERLGALWVMLSFGVGAATSLLLAGWVLRRTVGRKALATVSRIFKPVMGATLLLGLAIASGADTKLEAQLLELLPSSWVDWIARFWLPGATGRTFARASAAPRTARARSYSITSDIRPESYAVCRSAACSTRAGSVLT